MITCPTRPNNINLGSKRMWWWVRAFSCTSYACAMRALGILINVWKRSLNKQTNQCHLSLLKEQCHTYNEAIIGSLYSVFDKLSSRTLWLLALAFSDLLVQPSLLERVGSSLLASWSVTPLCCDDCTRIVPLLSAFLSLLDASVLPDNFSVRLRSSELRCTSADKLAGSGVVPESSLFDWTTTFNLEVGVCMQEHQY